MPKQSTEVAVLGGGIQGCCLALELALRGFHVKVLEQDGEAMNRASLRNEGKIHLGLVYANEPSLKTARAQLQGALSFAPLIERWTSRTPSELGLSTPFHYLVAAESILEAEQLQSQYEKLDLVYREYRCMAPCLDYLGTRPERLYSPLSASELARYQESGQVSAGFATPELAISPDILAHVIRTAVNDNDLIQVHSHCRVARVSRSGEDLIIEFSDGNDQQQCVSAEQVANASGDSRLAIDASFGMETGEGWVYRLKYRVISALTDTLINAPSATMVIGRFGDVVIRPDATAYLSWYPSAMRGWCHDLSPPADWEPSCKGLTPAGLASELAEDFNRGIASWYSGLGGQRILQVDAGVIFAHGAADVDQPSSGLHSRTNFGVVSLGGYHSVNPGKLTTAPLTALAAADRISGRAVSDQGDLEMVLEAVSRD